MNRTCSLTMMNVSSKIQHKCFFFSPLPPNLFIYLFSIPCEIGAVFDQSDEKASAYTDGEGAGEPPHSPPPPAPRDRGLLQMDIGFHQSASNSAGKA